MKETIKHILRKNNLSLNSLEKFSWGQINHVYDIDGKYVLKIQKDLDVILHQVSFFRELNARGALVPGIFDYWLIDGREYILMDKLPWRKLSESWNHFNVIQKDKIIRQICKQLQIIHSVSFDNYSSQRPKEFSSWRKAIQNYTNFSTLDKKDFDVLSQKNIKLLYDYYQKYEYLLDNVSWPVMVHNDFHFENILYKNDSITAILDFDFARQAPREYELWHIIDFFHTPKYFVEEELEKLWVNFKQTDELKLFKKYYPDLFSNPDIIYRLRIYFMEDIIWHYESGNFSRANHQVESYFTSDWLERILNL